MCPCCFLWQLAENQESYEIRTLLATTTVSAKGVFQREGKLWLEAIHRRLGARKRMINPYFAEISRDLPRELFDFLVRILKSVPQFKEPRCFCASNKKGTVLTFTIKALFRQFMSILTGFSEDRVDGFLKRTLKGARSGNKVKVIVSEEQDLALVYKNRKGQLKISFHYGEWNNYGYPQHT